MMPRTTRTKPEPTIVYEYVVTVRSCPHDPSDPFDHYNYEVDTDQPEWTARAIIRDLYRDRSDLIAITLRPICQ
jgi:hypothetical protein